MAEIRVGISGWTYAPWRGKFYPDGLKQKLELPFASRRLNAIEINGTFYSLQRPSSFQSWYEVTPPDFRFALKGGRFLTHMLKLREPLEPLANYFASGVLCLREKLGPILWQFPPNMPFIEDRFKAFFDLLPRDTVELTQIAKQHDASRKRPVYLEADIKRPVRHAVEFRHESFLTNRFTDLLRSHNIALVIADVASKFPTAEDVTADWVYVRLHGSRQLYASGYTKREIKAWAAKVRAWHQGIEPPDARRISSASPPTKAGRDVYVFFDNTDVKLRAPVDARTMAEELGIGPGETVSQVLNELSANTNGPKTTRSLAQRPSDQAQGHRAKRKTND
jgi:uncharacterized protein YecE (DUF72 family)